MIAQGPTPIYKGMNTAKLYTYSNGKEYVEINYTKKDGSNETLLIDVGTS